jgi:hypothetical protein
MTCEQAYLTEQAGKKRAEELALWKSRAKELANVALAAWTRMPQNGWEPEWVQTATDVIEELKGE